MVLASSYPFLGIFWSMLIFFAWVIFIWVAITVLIDLFRRHDVSGWGKAAWVVLVVIAPFLGVLIYLIVRGHKMAEHAQEAAAAQDSAARAYIQQAAGTTSSTADELQRLGDLKAQGVISDAEFETAKAKALSS